MCELLYMWLMLYQVINAVCNKKFLVPFRDSELFFEIRGLSFNERFNISTYDIFRFFLYFSYVY